MKKLYFLFTLLITSITFAQTTVFQESFETYTNGTTYTTSQVEFSDGGGDFFGRTNLNVTAEDANDLIVGSYYNLSGLDGTFCFAAMDIDAANAAGSGGATVQTVLFNDVNITGYTNLTLAMLLAEDQPTSSFDWDGGDFFSIEVDYDNSGTFTKVFQVAANAATGFNVSQPMVDTDLDGIGDGAIINDVFSEHTVVLGTGNLLDIRLTFSGLAAGDEDIAIDNIRVIDGFVAAPTVSITSPANNTVFAPGTANVDVVFSTTNTTTETVDITINGTIATNVTSPFSIPTVDGMTYNVTVELVDGGGVVDTQTVTFSVASPTQVADLAALRAAYVASSNDSTIYYELMSTPTITYTRTSRNQKYCQDTTAGILIDDNPGMITTTFAEGDGISGLVGTVSEYNAVMQFRPSQDANVVAGTVVTPEVVTIAQIVANTENYESELVQILGANFTDAGATFAVSTVYPLTDPSARLLATMDFRTNFSEADYIGTVIPSGNIDLTVFVAEFNGTPQVVAKSTAGILGVTKNEIEGFSMYPNPVENAQLTINTLSFEDKTVQIFDLLGKQVFNKTISGTNNTVSLENLNTGIYILKLEEAGKVAVRKLVVK